MARRKKKKAETKAAEDRWLITYADLITLLMIFFLVMYSMSQLDAEKFKALAESLSVSLGGGGGGSGEIFLVDNSGGGPSLLDGLDSQENKEEPEKKDVEDDPEDSSGGMGEGALELMTMEGIKAKIDQFAQDNNIEAKLVSTLAERGLVVSIQETLLFESASAEITPSAHNILQKISSVLAAVPNYIKVEGHTDHLPIHTAKFPSNWELSVLRATNVLQILIRDGKIVPERLSATGFGEYRPISDNQTSQGRGRNRRVDLVILNSTYDLVEPTSW